MALDLHHATNNDVRNFLALYLCNLHFGAREGHILGKGAVVHIYGDEFIQPFSRQ